jgi:site-specific DNA-methyltransferase (adenine-specific)
MAWNIRPGRYSGRGKEGESGCGGTPGKIINVTLELPSLGRHGYGKPNFAGIVVDMDPPAFGLKIKRIDPGGGIRQDTHRVMGIRFNIHEHGIFHATSGYAEILQQSLVIAYLGYDSPCRRRIPDALSIFKHGFPILHKKGPFVKTALCDQAAVLYQRKRAFRTGIFSALFSVIVGYQKVQRGVKVMPTKTSSFGTNGRINHDSSKFYDSKLYKELGGGHDVSEEVNPFPPEYLNVIIKGSCADMKEIPANSLHLMITSPPYNASKEYDDDLSLQEYLDLLRAAFAETYRVLVNGGRACVNVANLGRRPYIPLSDYISGMMREIGFAMRGEIIWNKAASASPSTAWGSWQSAANPTLRDIHEYILIFSKGSYRRERTREELQAKQNTITKEQFMEWTKSIWTMNAESARRIGHPAPFPEELPNRLIQLYSFTNDIILDPFMGSGTTAVAAIKAKRKFVGYDINEAYIQLANTRIKNAMQDSASVPESAEEEIAQPGPGDDSP